MDPAANPCQTDRVTVPYETETGRRVAAEYSRHGDVATRWREAVLDALARAGHADGAARLLAVSERTAWRWVAWLRVAGVALPALREPGRPMPPREVTP